MEIPEHIGTGDGFIVKENDVELLLQVIEDAAPDNPRMMGNPGMMVCWHRRYSLGDEHSYRDGTDFLSTLATGKDFYEREREENDALANDREYDNPCDWDRDKIFTAIRKNHVILPLYLYDHSGITVSTSPFACRFDSGQVGWIYISKEKTFDTFSDATEENWQMLGEARLLHEVAVYDDYLTGNVFGCLLHTLDEKLEVVDTLESRFGFYGAETARNGIFDGYKPVRRVKIRQETTTRTFVDTKTYVEA